MLECTLPRILGYIEAPFLESVELQFHSEKEQQAVAGDWGRLQSALLELHFFGMSAVRIHCILNADSPLKEEAVDHSIRAGLHELDSRRALVVHVRRIKAAQGDQGLDE